MVMKHCQFQNRWQKRASRRYLRMVVHIGMLKKRVFSIGNFSLNMLNMVSCSNS